MDWTTEVQFLILTGFFSFLSPVHTSSKAFLGSYPVNTGETHFPVVQEPKCEAETHINEAVG
jgi:hypothetical protein